MLGWARGHELGAPGPGMGLGAGALEMSAGASESHVPPRPTCRLAPRGNPGAFSEPLSPYARPLSLVSYIQKEGEEKHPNSNIISTEIH